MKPVGARSNCQPVERDQAGVDHEHDRGQPDQPAGEAAVAVRQPVEQPVEAGEEAVHRAEQQRPRSRVGLRAA